MLVPKLVPKLLLSLKYLGTKAFLLSHHIKIWIIKNREYLAALVFSGSSLNNRLKSHHL